MCMFYECIIISNTSLSLDGWDASAAEWYDEEAFRAATEDRVAGETKVVGETKELRSKRVEHQQHEARYPEAIHQ